MQCKQKENSVMNARIKKLHHEKIVRRKESYAKNVQHYSCLGSEYSFRIVIITKTWMFIAMQDCSEKNKAIRNNVCELGNLSSRIFGLASEFLV